MNVFGILSPPIAEEVYQNEIPPDNFTIKEFYAKSL